MGGIDDKPVFGNLLRFGSFGRKNKRLGKGTLGEVPMVRPMSTKVEAPFENAVCADCVVEVLSGADTQ